MTIVIGIVVIAFMLWGSFHCDRQSCHQDANILRLGAVTWTFCLVIYVKLDQKIDALAALVQKIP